MKDKLSKFKAMGLLIARLLIGLLFFYSGFSKLIRPIEYFEYAIGQYRIIPESLVHVAGIIVPWIEVIFGGYLIVGLWVFESGMVLSVLVFLFQIILGQALIRRIQIDDCGCFGGNFIHLGLFQSFVLDTVILLLLINISTAKDNLLTLDGYFGKDTTSSSRL